MQSCKEKICKYAVVTKAADFATMLSIRENIKTVKSCQRSISRLIRCHSHDTCHSNLVLDKHDSRI